MFPEPYSFIRYYSCLFDLSLDYTMAMAFSAIFFLG